MDNSREDYETLLTMKETFGRDVSAFKGLLEKMPSIKGGGGMKKEAITTGFENLSDSELDAKIKELQGRQ